MRGTAAAPGTAGRRRWWRARCRAAPPTRWPTWAGAAWYRLAPSAARWWPRTWRAWRPPPGGPPPTAPSAGWSQRAFMNHARYWLEMLRSPYYRDRADPRDHPCRRLGALGAGAARRGGDRVAAPGQLRAVWPLHRAARPARRGAGRGDGPAGALRLPASPDAPAARWRWCRCHAPTGRCWPRCAVATWWRSIADRDLDGRRRAGDHVRPPHHAARRPRHAGAAHGPAPDDGARAAHRPGALLRPRRAGGGAAHRPDRRGRGRPDRGPGGDASRRPSARRRTSGGPPSSRSGPISAPASRDA